MVTDTFDRIHGMIVMQKGARFRCSHACRRGQAGDQKSCPGERGQCGDWVRANVINGKEIVSPPRFFFGADIRVHEKMIHSLYKGSGL